MKTWDAAVVVLIRGDGKVLGVTRGSNLRDINLPGGYREPGDESPANTAWRELLEETGLQLRKARFMGNLASNGKKVVAFRGTAWTGELRPSSEGYPVWVDPKRLFHGSHGKAAQELLQRVKA